MTNIGLLLTHMTVTLSHIEQARSNTNRMKYIYAFFCKYPVTSANFSTKKIYEEKIMKYAKKKINITELNDIQKHVYYAPITEDGLFKRVMSDRNCMNYMINACPELRDRNLTIIDIDTQLHLTPNEGFREYIPDVVVETEESETSKKVFIDFEMQQNMGGSEQIRAEAYISAIRCIASVKGSDWKDMPDVITVMFVNRIPIGHDLCYRTASMHGVGLDDNGEEHFDEESHTMVIYVRLDLHLQEKLLNKCPYLQELADLVHDFHETNGDNMCVAAMKTAVNNIKEDPAMLTKVSEEFQKLIDEKTAKAKAEGIAEGKAEGKAEGIVEGIEKGRAEGRAEKIRCIRNLAESGIPIAAIAKAYDYTEAEIMNIMNLGESKA